MTNESPFWVSPAPVTQTVLWGGREVPVVFRLLLDREEAQIVTLVASEPLDLPDKPAYLLPTYLVPFWKEDMSRRVAALRSAQETRYRLAYSILTIDGKDFAGLPLERRIADVMGWPGV